VVTNRLTKHLNKPIQNTIRRAFWAKTSVVIPLRAQIQITPSDDVRRFERHARHGRGGV
jgi:hypothetical protein